MAHSAESIAHSVGRRQLIADSSKLIGKIEGRWTTVPLGRRKMEDGSKNNFSPQMDPSEEVFSIDAVHRTECYFLNISKMLLIPGQ